MEAIINFFVSIAEVVNTLILFVVDFIAQIGTLAKMLLEAVTAIPMVLVVMPPPATVALTSIITIAVAYKLLGRE